MWFASGRSLAQVAAMKIVLIPILAALAGSAVASPVIDDAGLRARFLKQLGAVADRKEHVRGEDLAKQTKEAREKQAPSVPRPGADAVMKYDDEVKGVVVISSVYKCDKCDEWHLGGGATGWVLAEDGLVVTNHHVVSKADREAYGVMALDGTFGEVVEVVAANREADIAVLRVKGEGFQPLPLAKEVSVGEPVHVISHPDGRYFTYTAGRVSRLYKRGRGRPTTWMAITADYAKGSSGGPVFNDRGEVIGMVSSTNTIHYDSKGGDKDKQKGPAQMVVKNCVSLQELRNLLVPKASAGKSGTPGE